MLKFLNSQRPTVLELKDSVASTLPEFGVTTARHFTTSLENDLGDVGFFLGVSLMISAETSRRLLSISPLMLVEKKCK